MSIRPLLRQAPVMRSVRAFGSSVPRKAEHGHGHEGAEDQSQYNTHETFFNPTWRNTFLLVTASILVYPYLPSPSAKGMSPSLDPEAFAAARQDPELPALTRWLAKQTEKADEWRERTDRHLQLAKEMADTKLLFQEAERPKVHRMRYPSSFEQASPFCIPIGSQIDLSDLNVKTAH